MKHMNAITRNKPAVAICGVDHPNLMDSLKGLLEDPIGTIELHLDKQQEETL